MSKFKIYLFGQMSGLTYEEMNEWREEATKILQLSSDLILTVNPCHFYNFLIDANTYTEKEVKLFDLHQVRTSNLLLGKMSNSIGTAQELQVAEDNHIPIIGYGDSNNVHPWMMLALTKMCPTLEDAIDHIVKFYLPNV